MSEELNQVPGVEVPAGAQVPGTNLEQGGVQAAETSAEAPVEEQLNDNTIGEAPVVADPEHSAPAEEQPVAPVDPMQPVGPN